MVGLDVDGILDLARGFDGCYFEAGQGPEVFRTADQLQRTCLEDVVMAKLHGLTMGLDVCATFHMGITPAALQETTRRIVDLAARAYLMAVAGNADPMLGYLM